MERAALSPYTDVMAWSQQPPGLSPVDVPQFVAVTFDDNFNAGAVGPPGAMTWATKFFEPLKNPDGTGFAPTFDGAPARTSFYNNTQALGNPGVLQSWVKAREDGHELANHTQDHPNGALFTADDWTAQIVPCTQGLTNPTGVGLPLDALKGFRSPFLAYSPALFGVLKAQGLWYDTSIQSCWGDGQDGKNCGWPHTLDQVSPDAADLAAKFKMPEVPVTTGLWEMSTSALFVPPDELATEYGFDSGLRGRIEAVEPKPGAPSYYEAATGRIAPLDITLFVDYDLSGPEVLAILKYTLDLRLEGNRAPFIFIAHSHVYATDWDQAPAAPMYRDRQGAIEEFVKYALSKPVVRMRPVADIMDWMREPMPLDGKVTMPVTTAGAGGSAGTGGGGGPGVGGASAGSTMGGATAGVGSSTSAGSGSGGSSTDDGGCDCRTAPRRGLGSSWLALAALAGVLGRRRSRR
jgi:hypothetical protein